MIRLLEAESAYDEACLVHQGEKHYYLFFQKTRVFMHLTLIWDYRTDDSHSSSQDRHVPVVIPALTFSWSHMIQSCGLHVASLLHLLSSYQALSIPLFI